LAVDRLDSTADATAEARLWFASGLLAPPTEGDVEVAAYERAVALYRHSRNDKALCLALIVLARTLIRTGDAESASRAFAEARRLLDVAGTPKLRGLYQHALGRQEYAAGNASLARDLFASALACFEQAGCEALALLALFDQGDAAWCLIDLDAAAASFEEAADRIRRSSIGNKRAALGRATGSLTGVLIEQGKFSEAVQVAGMVVPVPGDGNGERVFVALALRLALIGRYEDAGRLLGWVEGAYAPAHQLRDPNLQRMRPRLLAILAQHVEDRLQVLRAEGASANDEEAWRIAAWVE
jgi:tetratricopeptide (TPR) repeat protein